MLSERAPAKVNLSLHVLGRRADGYHRLESLVVFASCHDTLRLAHGQPLGITVSGPRAGAAGPDADNLVIKAARNLAGRVDQLALGHFSLDKHLPAAAGLGGGSSDAAAALRLLARLNHLALDDPRLIEAARATGADVPVCLDPRPAMMRGIGDRIERLVSLPTLHGVLVNPGKPVETRAVFSALGLAPGSDSSGAAHPDLTLIADAGDLIARLKLACNDLEPPACRIEPAISEVIAALQATGALLVRMSGSGASVFALYETSTAAQQVARRLGRLRANWWIEAVMLASG